MTIKYPLPLISSVKMMLWWCIVLSMVSFMWLGGVGSSVTNEEYLHVEALTLANVKTFPVSASLGAYSTGLMTILPSTVLIGGGNQVMITKNKVKLNEIDGKIQYGLNNGTVLVTDLRLQTIFTFLNETTDFIIEPDFIYELQGIQVNKVLGNNYEVITINKRVKLSKEVWIGFDSLILNGFGYCIVVDGDSRFATKINLVSGLVTELGYTKLRWRSSQSWIAYGIAETTTLKSYSMLYGSVDGRVERQALFGGSELDVFMSAGRFDHLSTISIDVQANLWYFYFRGNSSFLSVPKNGRDRTTVGFADASFISIPPTSQPTSQPSSSPTTVPTRQPSLQPFSRPSSSPSAQPSVLPTGQPKTAPSSSPTAKPSSLPSSLPSSIPTLNAAAPVLQLLSHSADRTKLFLTFLLDANRRFPGTVYCTAVVAGRVASKDISFSYVQSSGDSISYVANSASVSITINRLVPAADYDVYCAVQTLSGYKSLIKNIQVSFARLTTACCKQISWGTIPKILYADVAKYQQSTNAISNVMTYQLEYLPSTVMKVTPVIKYLANNQVVEDIRCQPSSTIFYGNQSITKGEFVLLSSNKELSGDVYVTLQIENSLTASEYQLPVTSPNIRLLSNTDPPLTPSFISAQLSDSGQSMVLAFDQATNLASMKILEVWPCQRLFTFVGVEATTCTWLNKTHIIANIPSNLGSTSDTLLIDIHDDVTLHGGIIQAECQSVSILLCRQFYGNASQQAIALAPPNIIINPQVVLQGPPSIGLCDNLYIDAEQSTGNAGRRWKTVEWLITVLDFSPSDATTAQDSARTIQAFLNENKLLSYKILRAKLFTGKYLFSLALTNFLDVTSSSTVQVDVSSNPYLPRIAVLGESIRSMIAKDDLMIEATARFSSCFNASGLRLQYDWMMFSLAVTNEVQLPFQGIKSQHRNPAIFSLLPYTLNASQTYQITLNVSVYRQPADIFLTPLANVQTSVRVQIVHGSLAASIKGGNAMLQLPISSNVSLDASSSSDADRQGITHLLFQWNCMFTSNQEFGTSCNHIFAANTRTQMVAIIIGSRLHLEKSYRVELIVSTIDRRTANTFIAVLPLPADAPLVQITSLNEKFNTDGTFVIQGTIASPTYVKGSWEAFIAGSKYDFESDSTLEKMFNISSPVSNFVSFPLVVKGDSFATAGVRVTFRLTAATTSQTSFSAIQIMANVAPSSGQFIVTPLIGQELSTLFTMQGLYWIDDVNDYPLTYDFQVQTSPAQNAMAIQGRSTSYQAISSLAAGYQSYGYQVTLIMNIYDKYLASAYKESRVNVTAAKEVDVSSYITNSLSEADSSFNTNLLWQTISNAGQKMNSVNCSKVTNSFCDSLQRMPCSDVANTCGNCRTGYVGISSSLTNTASNTPCYSSTAELRTRLLTSTKSCHHDEDCNAGYECVYSSSPLGEVASICVVANKECPSTNDLICSGHGTCDYYDLNGYRSGRCLLSDDNCDATCICVDDYSGEDCSLSPSQAIQREADRRQLCLGIQLAYNLSTPSSLLLANLATMLQSSYDAKEVNQATTLELCQTSMYLMIALVKDGHLNSTNLGTKVNILTSLSKFISTGNQYNVSLDDVWADLTTGYLMSMSSGQTPMQLISRGIQMTVRKDLLVDMVKSPMSISDGDASKSSSFIEFTEVGISRCLSNAMEGYAEMSMTQFDRNPLANSRAAASKLLRLMTNSEPTSSSEIDTLSTEVAYYLTIQLAIAVPSVEESNGNQTIPTCQLYSNNTYVECSSCELISYNPHFNNATFACYDIAQICGGDNNDASSNIFPNRKLQDRKAAVITRTTQVVAFLKALQKESATVLSINPFAVDIEEASGVISFMMLLVLSLIGFSVYFYRWDQSDRNQLIYNNNWPPKSSTLHTAMGKLSINRARRKAKKMLKEVEEDENEEEIEELVEDTKEVSISPVVAQHSDIEQGLVVAPTLPSTVVEEPVTENVGENVLAIKARMKAKKELEDKKKMQIKLKKKKEEEEDGAMEAECSFEDVDIFISKDELMVFDDNPLNLLSNTSFKSPSSLSSLSPYQQNRLSKFHRLGSSSNPLAVRSSRSIKSGTITRPPEEKLIIAAEVGVENISVSAIPDKATPGTVSSSLKLPSKEMINQFSSSNNSISSSHGSSKKLKKTSSGSKPSLQGSRVPSLRRKRSIMDQSNKRNKLFASTITDFFDLVIPDILRHDQFTAYFYTLLNKHAFTTAFIRSSTTNSSRLIRWLSLCKSVLIGLFVDTLFFQIFYANNGYCQNFVDEESCLAEIHSITQQQVCSWSMQTIPCAATTSLSNCDIQEIITCQLASPPTHDLFFTLFLALATLLICVPIEILLTFLLNQFCCKRPNIELLGWNVGYWLGGYIAWQEHVHSTNANNATVSNASNLNSKDVHHSPNKSSPSPPASPVKDASNGIDSTTFLYQSKLAGLMLTSEQQLLVEHLMMTDHMTFLDDERISAIRNLFQHVQQRTSNAVYQDYKNTDEEVMFLLAQIKHHFDMLYYQHPALHSTAIDDLEDAPRITKQRSQQSKKPLLQSIGPSMVELSLQRKLEVQAWKESFDMTSSAIVQYVGIRRDGSFRRLTLLERVWYATPYDKLHAKMESIRQQEMQLSKSMACIAMMSPALQEVVLLHHFILEQFSFFKQWLLTQQFHCFEDVGNVFIHPVTWLVSWFVVIGFMTFFVYWILAWSVYNGDRVLLHWGVNFILSTMQDIFFIQLTKILLLYLILLTSIRPQLVHMRWYLRSMATDYLQGQSPLRKQLAYRHALVKNQNMEVTDVASIAASSSSSILQQASADDIQPHSFSVLSFLSPTCRLSWHKACDNLAMGRILRQVDDIDMLSCRKNVDYRLGWMVVIVIMLGMCVLALGDQAGEALLNISLPVLSTAFVLASAKLYQVSIGVLIIVYLVVAAWIIHRCRLLHVFRSLSQLKQPPGTVGSQLGVLVDRLWMKAKRERLNSMQSASEDQNARKPLPFLQTLQRWIVNRWEAWNRFYFYQIRKPKLHRQQREFRTRHQWQMLNMPSDIQATVADHLKASRPAGAAFASSSAVNSQRLPAAILALRNSKWYEVLDTVDYKDRRLQPTFVESLLLKYVLQSDVLEEPVAEAKAGTSVLKKYDASKANDQQAKEQRRRLQFNAAQRYVDKHLTCGPKIQEGRKLLLALFCKHYYRPTSDIEALPGVRDLTEVLHMSPEEVSQWIFNLREVMVKLEDAEVLYEKLFDLYSLTENKPSKATPTLDIKAIARDLLDVAEDKCDDAYYLSAIEIRMFKRDFKCWYAKQDKLRYTSKAIKDMLAIDYHPLHAFYQKGNETDNMKKDEDKLLDVTTEVGRRYALLIRTSDTHNLHNYLPFALVASFFTQRCYDYIVYYRDPLHRRGHLPQQKLQSNEDEDELFMTYSQAGSSLANSRTNSMYQQQTQQSFDEDFFIPSLEREDANAFSDLLPEQEQNLVDIYQAALEEASLASPPPASHFAAIRPNKTNLSTSTFPRNQTSKQSYSPPDGPRPAKFHPTPAPFGKQNSIESVPDDISAMYMSSTNTSPSLSPAPSFLGYRSNSVNTVMSYQSRFSLDHSPSSNN